MPKFKKYTIAVGVGGQMTNKIVMDVRNENGLAIARLTADEFLGFAQIRGEAENKPYKMSISDGEHELLFVGRVGEEGVEAFYDNEPTGKVIKTYVGRYDECAAFIGHEL